jgi:hypothetical protein
MTPLLLRTSESDFCLHAPPATIDQMGAYRCRRIEVGPRIEELLIWLNAVRLVQDTGRVRLGLKQDTVNCQRSSH